MSVAAKRSLFDHLPVVRITKSGLTRLLLACGVAFPALWVGMDVVASLLYDGYSYRDQTVSELSAIGAPTRTFWLVFGALTGLLAIAFAAGVWLSAAGKRTLRVVAGLLAALALVNLTLGPFSSMHQREVLAADGATFSDTLHLVLVGAGAIVFLLEAAFASTAFGRRFRLYTAATVIVVLVCGFITSLYAPEVQANEPTPWLGIIERISAYGYELWIAVLAVALIRRNAVMRETAGPEGRNNDVS
jgi:hypothetical protein